MSTPNCEAETPVLARCCSTSARTFFNNGAHSPLLPKLLIFVQTKIATVHSDAVLSWFGQRYSRMQMARVQAKKKKEAPPQFQATAPANVVVDPMDDIVHELEKIRRQEDVWILSMLRDPQARRYLIKVVTMAQDEIRSLRLIRV